MPSSPVVEALLMAEAENPNCNLRLYLAGREVILKRWQIVRGGERQSEIVGIAGLRESPEDKRKGLEPTSFNLPVIDGVGIIAEAIGEKLMRRFVGR